MSIIKRLLHKGESRCCFRDSASVTYEGMLPSDLTLRALRFILSAKSRQSCLQDCETVDFYNSLIKSEHNLLSRERNVCIHQCTHSLTISQTMTSQINLRLVATAMASAILPTPNFWKRALRYPLTESSDRCMICAISLVLTKTSQRWPNGEEPQSRTIRQLFFSTLSRSERTPTSSDLLNCFFVLLLDKLVVEGSPRRESRIPRGGRNNPYPKFHGRKRVIEAGCGQERLSYGLCVLQILIFLKGASRRPSFW